MTVQHAKEQRLTYGAAEAARLLGVSRDLLYALIRRGELRSVRIGHMRNTDADAVEAWVDKYCRKNPLKDVSAASGDLDAELLKPE